MPSVLSNARAKHTSPVRLPSSASKVEIVRRLSDIPMTRLYQENGPASSDIGMLSYKSSKKLSSIKWENAFETAYLQQFSPSSDEASTMSCQSYSSLSASDGTEPTPPFPHTMEVENDKEFGDCFDEPAQITREILSDGEIHVHRSSSCYGDDDTSDSRFDLRDEDQEDDSSYEGRETHSWDPLHFNPYVDARNRESDTMSRGNGMISLVSQRSEKPLPPLPLEPPPLHLRKGPEKFSEDSLISNCTLSTHSLPTYIHQGGHPKLQEGKATQKVLIPRGLPPYPSRNDLMLLELVLDMAFKVLKRVSRTEAVALECAPSMRQPAPHFPDRGFAQSSPCLISDVRQWSGMSHCKPPSCASRDETFGEGTILNGIAHPVSSNVKKSEVSDTDGHETSFFDHSHEEGLSDSVRRSVRKFFKETVGSKLLRKRDFPRKAKFWRRSTTGTESTVSRRLPPLWKRGLPIQRRRPSARTSPAATRTNRSYSERMEILRANLLRASSASMPNVGNLSSPSVGTISEEAFPVSPIACLRFEDCQPNPPQMQKGKAIRRRYQMPRFTGARSSSLPEKGPKFGEHPTTGTPQFVTGLKKNHHGRTPSSLLRSEIYELDSEPVSPSKPTDLGSRPPPVLIQKEVAADAAEAIILRILQHIDRLEDLLAMACVSASTFRVFKDHEMSLIEGLFHQSINQISDI